MPAHHVLAGERLEALLRAATFGAMPPDLVKRLRVRVAEARGAVATVVGRSDSLQLNQIVALGALEPATRPSLDALLGAFDEERVARVAIHLPPGARPRTLGAWLDDRGFREHGARVMLSRPATPPLAARCSFAIRDALPAEADTFATLYRRYGWANAREPWFARLVGRPPFHVFFACDGDRPVATGSLLVDGRDAMLLWAATATSHRNRGAQSALVAARLQRAIELGCETLYVTTAPPESGRPSLSHRNLLRAAFTEAYRQTVLVRSSAG